MINSYIFNRVKKNKKKNLHIFSLIYNIINSRKTLLLCIINLYDCNKRHYTLSPRVYNHIY